MRTDVILDVMKRRNDTRAFADGLHKLEESRTPTKKSSKGAASTPSGKPKRPAKVRPLSLRIIGGDMRGRTVHYHGAAFTRPMKDSVRESLFNIVGLATKGAICFDLFAGTGALAFEALSRGASKAIAIEQSRTAARHIRETAESLGVTERLTILTGDAFRWSLRLLAPPETDTPWIVLLSPPYVMWEENLEELNNIIRMTLENAPPGSILVGEMDKFFDPAKLLPGDWDLRRYGNTQLAIIEAANCCGLDL